ncbi:MAG: DEAD/DEAH box helicase [Bacteroidales bacterium]|nr:DEAD/DEAH box helicase [Bacteroidales bacterium]MCF8457890.1 DEAD/DEAH box helicase [Bacteroidales bacterium]
MKFSEFNFHNDILTGLESMGFENTTPIQEQSIPLIMEGRDLIACAQTGTGKTAAYLLPIINSIINSPGEGIKAIIIAPTRELAQQIDQQMAGFAYFLPVSSIAIYGGGDGVSWDQQKAALVQGADIVIATPGRFISHLSFEYVDTSNLQFLILDEADRMLDMGFHDDIMSIISTFKGKWQTLMFSATMPDKIRFLTKKILRNPAEVNIAMSKPAEGITQAAYMVHDTQKIGLIKDLLKKKPVKSIIIFSATKSNVKLLHRNLVSAGFNAAAIHSDLEQEEREKVMLDFRNRKVQILVATNIVSRGIDIVGIDLIINYDVPRDAEDYIHRIGRTARAESSGLALTFINEKEQLSFQKIEKMIEKVIYKAALPDHLGDGPVYNPKLPSKGGRSSGRQKGKVPGKKKTDAPKEKQFGHDKFQKFKPDPAKHVTPDKKKRHFWKKKKNKGPASHDGIGSTD